jgi:hypothetical protein
VKNEKVQKIGEGKVVGQVFVLFQVEALLNNSESSAQDPSVRAQAYRLGLAAILLLLPLFQRSSPTRGEDLQNAHRNSFYFAFCLSSP